MLSRYGLNSALFAILSADPDSHGALKSLPDYCLGEIQYFCQHEYVVQLDDLIFRRTTLALEGRATRGVVEEIASLVGPLLQWDDAYTGAQLSRCLEMLPDINALEKCT